MRTLTVGFSRPKKLRLLSWLIRKLQKSEYSHVYLKINSELLSRDLVYQASGLQVNFIGLDLFSKENYVVREFTLVVSEDVYVSTVQFAVDRAGFPYSIKQILSLLVYHLSGKRIFTDSREAYVCSELVAEILKEKLGFDITKDLDIVTPKDIYEQLSEMTWQD